MRFNKIESSSLTESSIFLLFSVYPSVVEKTVVAKDVDFSGEWEDIGERYIGKKTDEFTYFYLYGVTKNGYPYSYELSGPNGAHYFIFIDGETTKEEIKEIKRELKQRFDVTGFTVYRCFDISCFSEEKQVNIH